MFCVRFKITASNEAVLMILWRRNPGTSLLNLLENPIRLFSLGRSRLIIVVSIVRRNGAGNEIGHIVSFDAVFIDGKGLLEDHGIQYFCPYRFRFPAKHEDDGRRPGQRLRQ